MAFNVYNNCFLKTVTVTRFISDIKYVPFLIRQNCQITIASHIRKCYSSRNSQQNSENQISNIYYGVLTPQIKAVKVFSLTTSFGGCLAQPIIFSQSENIGGLPILISICAFVGFFTFVTPFLLHMITKKYVTHLEYNSATDEYTASVVTFFLTTRKITFSTKDVHVPDVPGMFTSFIAKGSPLFVDPRLFPNPQHYAKIMGYDKPIDLKLNLDLKEETKKKL